MTPELMELLMKYLEIGEKKRAQLELEEVRRESFKEGKKEAKEEIAKNLKAFYTPEEISKITGLSVAAIVKL